MKIGHFYLSTGFRGQGTGHFLISLHRRWLLSFVRPEGKPGYRRFYLGPVEFEWSQAVTNKGHFS